MTEVQGREIWRNLIVCVETAWSFVFASCLFSLLQIRSWIFLRTLLWKFMLGCYQMVSRHQSTREATMAHMPCPWSCLVTWFSWKWPLVPLSARPITARRGMASTAYSCSQELKSAAPSFSIKGIIVNEYRIVRRFMIEISWKESSMFWKWFRHYIFPLWREITSSFLVISSWAWHRNLM